MCASEFLGRRARSRAADDSPSPWGEGRGEGELLVQAAQDLGYWKLELEASLALPRHSSERRRDVGCWNLELLPPALEKASESRFPYSHIELTLHVQGPLHRRY